MSPDTRRRSSFRSRLSAWQRDPNDREANYRRPVPQEERVRLGLKGALVVAGFLFIMNATRDRSDVGAEFAIGVGGPLLVAGVMDVIWTLRGRLEHVFIESRPLQLAAHAAMAVTGMVLVAAGVIAKAV